MKYLLLLSMLLSRTAFAQDSLSGTIRLKGEQEWVMPQFPGGDTLLNLYLKANLIYPEIALRNGTEGRVTIRFVVRADGSLEDIEVLKKLSKELDAEAIRLVSGMPPWMPGYRNGKAVPMTQYLPINFKVLN
jgi:protein TonB